VSLMLRIIHTADFHLGASLRERPVGTSLKREEDFIRQMWRIRDETLKMNADFLIIAGDIFHHIPPSGTIFAEFASFLNEITKNEIYVIVSAGNHDIPRGEYLKSHLTGIHELKSDKFIFAERGFREFEAVGRRSGRKVAFLLIPYIHKSIKLDISNEAIHDRDLSKIVSKILNEKVEKFIDNHQSADYKIIVAHCLVEGAICGSERRITAIDDICISRGAFNKSELDYVALGHIHHHQRITDKIIYAGSIEKVDFGEENEDKFLTVIEEEKNELKAREIELKCRPMITIPKDKKYFDLRGLNNPTDHLLSMLLNHKINFKDAIIRVKALVTPDQNTLIYEDKIEKALKSKGAFYSFIDITSEEVEYEENREETEKFEDTLRKYIEEIGVRKRISRDDVELIYNEALRIWRMQHEY